MTTTYPPFDTDEQRKNAPKARPDLGEQQADSIAPPPTEPQTPIQVPARRAWRRWALVGLAILLVGAALGLKGTGVKTRVMIKLVPGYQERLAAPEVVSAWPKDGVAGLRLDPTFHVTIKIPNGRLNEETINDQTIWLIRTHDQQPTPIDLKVLNNGSRIEVRPRQPLRAKTQYTLCYTNGVEDVFARPLKPFLLSFTTHGTSDPMLRFEKVALPTATGAGFTAVVMGPDQKLWAGSDDGRIFRFPILSDGMLGEPEVLDSLQKAEGAPRILIGFCFDPNSTPDHPIIWASHNFGTFNNPPDFTGKISRLSGKNLETCEDVVIHLPRSVRDHMNNQPSFGPDGALYWPQPSNSAYGDADPIWGMRPENLLNASILRLDVSKWTPGKPIDAKTTDAGGTYDPFAPGAPLTIYAFGVRLAYDLVWHSNGRLYVPTNGSAAGGNTPTNGRGNGVALKNIPIDEDDWLFRITPGKYYGHPNPRQGFYVLNGGNPTAGYDYAEMPLYPVGTYPDPNWERSVYDFGRHVSANGAIEYRDVAFDGKLDKVLMVCRYNFGSDIIVLHLDENGDVSADDTCIPGLGNLTTPLDLVQDPRNGNLYVTEYGEQCITLLRAAPVR